MENKNDFNEERFDSFLNKTIILSSRKYYKNESKKDVNELKIIDDEDYSSYMQKYLNYSIDEVCGLDNINNSDLILALKSLSNIEMTVIFLLFEKQLTSSEASKILEICSDSVTRIKRRALKKIEKYLKGGK